jgi:hypothetical protein
MTGPIVFLPTPVAPTTQTADGELSWSAVASTTDQNFERINSYARDGKPWPQAWTTKLTGTPFLPPTQSNWTQFGASFPALTIPVPQNCQGMWVIVSAQGETTHQSHNQLAVAVEMSGAGFTAASSTDWFAVGGSGLTFGASRIELTPASVLVPGQNAVFTPVYQQVSSGQAPIGARIEYAEVFVIVLA